jgi:bacterioferritin-associated ferredoxin
MTAAPVLDDQMRMRCNVVRNLLQPDSIEAARESAVLYVCNCNGIREREVRQAIDEGASRPADIFRRQQCQPQCAKCVCDMRQMIDEQRETLRYAAE